MDSYSVTGFTSQRMDALSINCFRALRKFSRKLIKMQLFYKKLLLFSFNYESRHNQEIFILYLTTTTWLLQISDTYNHCCKHYVAELKVYRTRYACSQHGDHRMSPVSYLSFKHRQKKLMSQVQIRARRNIPIGSSSSTQCAFLFWNYYSVSRCSS